MSGGEAAPSSGTTRLPWPVALFLVSLIVPWIISVGPLSLSAYRMVLLAMLLPCLTMWVRGKAGSWSAPDIGILLYCLWAAISIMVAHGFDAVFQSGGILFVETAGAYLLARCYIRGPEDFRNMVVLAAKIVIFLLPFALYEWMTGSKPLLSTLGSVFPIVQIVDMPQRSGFWRVQGPFDHPIAFGLFCGSILALTHLVGGDGRRPVSRGIQTALVAVTAFLCMSSAPIAGLVVQVALMVWNRVLKPLKGRWKILWVLIFAGYLVVEFGSNQTPIQFYISHFTFDQQTGWFRLWIWEYGSASVVNHPLFGIGFADWARPAWISDDSVDNFWLAISMRHGIPAFVLMLGSCLWVMMAVAFKAKRTESFERSCVAYLICMTTCLLVGTTVHFWGAPYTWFLFLLGSGAWLLHARPEDEAVPARRDRTRGSLSRASRARAGVGPAAQPAASVATRA